MSQKKKKKKKNKSYSPIYILLILIGLISYYFYTGPDKVIEIINTTYSAITEYSETTSENYQSSYVSSDLDVYFFDVGQADATLICNNGEYMLIDAGNNADGKKIVKQLQDMGIEKINYLIGTHPHEDHIGGLDDVISNFKIGKIYMPKREADSKTFEDVLDAVANKNLKVTTPKKGTIFSLGEAECKVLSVESDAADTNDSSIVVQLNFGNNKFLFTGDLTSNMEPNISWEDIDILKVAHHGSRYSSSQEFLNKTQPEISIISAGINNDYGHPHQEALKRLNKVSSEIYRTDKSGTVHISSDGENIDVEFLKISLDGNEK